MLKKKPQRWFEISTEVIVNKKHLQVGMAHAFNSITLRTEAGGSL